MLHFCKHTLIKRILKRVQKNFKYKKLNGFYLVYNDQVNEWLIIPESRANIYYYGHEQNIVDIVKSSLDKNMVFIDIGAFIGFYTILASKLGAIVYSFEPDPRSYILLKLNLYLSGLIKKAFTFNIAIGDAKGTITFKLANSYAESSATNYLSEDKIVGLVKVPVITLDDFVTEYNIDRVNLIKIDVEGYGANVLDGALNIINIYQPNIIFEVHRFDSDIELKKLLYIKYKYKYRIKMLEYRNNRNFIVYLYK